jgi:hypothetical protein
LSNLPWTEQRGIDWAKLFSRWMWMECPLYMKLHYMAPYLQVTDHAKET